MLSQCHKQLVIDQTVELIEEVATESIYERDLSEEYELGIELCFQTNTEIEHIDTIMEIINHTVKNYTALNHISIIQERY